MPTLDAAAAASPTSAPGRQILGPRRSSDGTPFIHTAETNIPAGEATPRQLSAPPRPGPIAGAQPGTSLSAGSPRPGARRVSAASGASSPTAPCPRLVRPRADGSVGPKVTRRLSRHPHELPARRRASGDVAMRRRALYLMPAVGGHATSSYCRNTTGARRLARPSWYVSGQQTGPGFTCHCRNHEQDAGYRHSAPLFHLFPNPVEPVTPARR